MNWSRVADFAQRTFSVSLLGLTLCGVLVLAQGGYRVVQRRKQQKAVEITQQVARNYF